MPRHPPHLLLLKDGVILCNNASELASQRGQQLFINKENNHCHPSIYYLLIVICCQISRPTVERLKGQIVSYVSQDKLDNTEMN